MDPGVLALLIPVLAIATGLVAVLKMPRDAFRPRGHLADDPRIQMLQDEVSQLREELRATRERVDFTERLLAERPPPALPRGDSSDG